MTKAPKKPKSPRGRPLRGDAATVGFTLKFTAEERAAYDEAAKAADVPLSQWIRDCCDARLGR